MKKYALIVSGIIAFIAGACSSPLDKRYNEATLQDDMTAISEYHKEDSAVVARIALYIVRAKMMGENLDGNTYGNLLEKATELQKQKDKQEAEAKALAEKMAREAEEKRTTFSKLLVVALFDKGYYQADYQDYLSYDVAFDNKSGKDIRAVKGTLLITDLFDSKITAVSLVEDDGLPAGKITRRSYTTKYNQFRDEDVRLRNKNLKDLKVIWTTEKIIFSDGSIME